MRELSDILREAARGASTDVSETIDIASSILTQIVSTSAGSDPNENVARDVAEFYEMAIEKEREFKEKMEQKKDGISVKINALSTQLEVLEDKLTEKSQQHQKFLKEKSVEFGKRNRKLLAEEKVRLKEEEKRVEEEKKARYEDFELFLSKKMAELAEVYAQKLKDADIDLSTVNVELQTTVHSKHEEKRLMKDDLDIENRRMASEHERLSREYQERRHANEQMEKELDMDIARTKVAVERAQAATQMRLKKMEQDFTGKKQREIEEAKQKAQGLEDQKKKLKTFVEKLKFDVEKEKADMAMEFQEMVVKKKEAMQHEMELTKQEVEADKKETETWYKEKCDAVTVDIETLKQQRKAQQEEMSRLLFEDQDTAEQDDSNEREKHEDGVRGLKDTLKERKKELVRVRGQKDQALSDLKQSQQKRMSSSLANSEQNEKQRLEQINALMKKFDEQQNKLTYLHQLTVEQLDKEKAEAILRLKHEHEMRKQTIILQVEAQIREEIEKRMARAAEVEEEEHQNLLKDIQKRIDGVTSRVDLLNMKLEGLERATKDKLDELLKDMDPNLVKELQEIAKNGNTDRGNELVNRLRSATVDVERRKQLVVKESNAITANLNAMKSDFEMKLAKIEQEYETNKQRLLGAQKNSEIKKEQLNDQMNAQQKRLEDLSQAAAFREKEASNFEKNIETEKEKYQETTKDSYEASLAQARNEPKTVEEEIKQFKESATLEMSQLKDQLELAKANTERITEYRLKERTDAFEEIEVELETKFSERRQAFEDHHVKRMQELHDKRDRARKKQNELRMEVEQELGEIFDERKRAFEEKYHEYFLAKEELRERNESLAKEIEDLETKECPKCVAKKETLRRMIAKRDELKKMMGIHASEIQASEEEMYDIFGTPKPKVAHDILDAQKPLSSMGRKLLRPTLRPHSVLGIPGSANSTPYHPRMSPFR